MPSRPALAHPVPGLLPGRLPGLFLGLLLGPFLVSGCSSGGVDSAAARAASSSTSPSDESSHEPSPASAPAASCAVRGFHPSTRITARDAEPAVVYASKHTLPPTSTMRSPDDVGYRLDYLPLRVRVTSDGPARPTAADRQSILASAGGPVDGGRIADHVPLPYRLSNKTSDENRGYLVYRGALAWSGSWRMRVCGAPYNDGTTVATISGTYRTIGELLPSRTAVCGVLPPHPGPIARHAEDRACE
ncbi:hypothetical protein ACT8ZV_16920 [Nocardioides sp. MAHUQ-72]|uniref:hypothetical protein n=1 Tax=unclassified Nocardioides TaxID=2615069 RepID=UPI0036220AB4